MTASRGRAMRRKNTKKKKAKFIRLEKTNPYWTDGEAITDIQAGIFANHGCNCSCWMCGNPRKYFGELTIQERKAHLDGILDVKDNDD